MFDPAKSKLMHFSRARRPHEDSLELTPDHVIRPTSEARFLRIWLDSKLNFLAHYNVVKLKFARQVLALRCLVAKTYGVSLARARQIYSMVIRTLLSYGAPVWHQPTEQGESLAEWERDRSIVFYFKTRSM